MRTLVMISLGVTLVFATGVFSQVPKTDDASAEDLKALQGRWKPVKAIREGEDVTKEIEEEKSYFEISGTILSFYTKGKIVMWQRITLDSKANPKRVDLVETDKKGTVQKRKATTKGAKVEEIEFYEKGLYELKGDQLRICLGHENEDRPKSFDPKEKAVFMVIELKKVKD